MTLCISVDHGPQIHFIIDQIIIIINNNNNNYIKNKSKIMSEVNIDKCIEIIK